MRPLPLAISATFTAIVLGNTLHAQLSFTDQTSQLSNEGINSAEFHSGVAMAVCDMNGDGRDDIIRFHDRRILSIEHQQSSGSGFNHKVFGRTSSPAVWAIAVGDFDQNGLNDILLGGDTGGLETWESIAGDSPGYRRSILPDRDIFSQGVILADIDNNGQQDIFACDDNDDPHNYLGDGLGNFVQDQNAIDTFIPGSAGNDPLSSGSYAAIWTDYDNDGKNDLYISKCRQGVSSDTDKRRINRLFKNNGNGTFTEDSGAAGLNDGAQSWSTDFADIDNDGDLDCFIINHNIKSRLMENNGGVFTEITTAAGISSDLSTIYGIQALFRDFDNDGYVDLILTSSSPILAHRVFHNNRDSTFTRLNDVLVEADVGSVDWIQSLATGDLNHDGFLDLYVGRGRSYNRTTSSSDLLFLNDGNSNHFLAVQLTGTASNRSGIGARIEIIGPWGTQVREVRGGEGYGITSSHTAHFGLASAPLVPTLRVRWPSGLIDEFTNIDADQFLSVTEGETLGPGDFTTPVITSSLSVSAAQSANFRYRVAATNLPTSFALGASAPIGMSIDTTSGLIEWTPASQGVHAFNIIASNPAGSDTESLSITVGANDLVDAIEASSLPVATGANAWTRDTTQGVDNDSARSATISNEASSWMETATTGPDHLIFSWKVSSEADDILRLNIDGIIIESISGIVDWSEKVLEIPSGTHTIRWEYLKNSSLSGGSDRAWVDGIKLASGISTPTVTSDPSIHAYLGVPFSHQITATKIPTSFSASALPAGLAFDSNTGLIYGTPTGLGSFTPNIGAINGAGTGTQELSIQIHQSLITALDSPELRWSTGGDARWSYQFNLFRTGSSIATSDDIGDGQSTWLQTSVLGPGQLTFWWSSSTEAAFDRLRFLVNGSEESLIDGVVSWTQQTVSIPPGPHDLRWSYEKDGSTSASFDNASLDDVIFTPTDSDNDNLPDGWELEYFMDLDEVASVDSDGDGQINSDELASGTNPNDSSSRFMVIGVSKFSGNDFALEWDSLAEKTYDIRASNNLTDWSPIFSDVAGTGASMSKTVDGSAFSYWRLVAD